MTMTQSSRAHCGLFSPPFVSHGSGHEETRDVARALLDDEAFVKRLIARRPPVVDAVSEHRCFGPALDVKPDGSLTKPGNQNSTLADSILPCRTTKLEILWLDPVNDGFDLSVDAAYEWPSTDDEDDNDDDEVKTVAIPDFDAESAADKFVCFLDLSQGSRNQACETKESGMSKRMRGHILPDPAGFLGNVMKSAASRAMFDDYLDNTVVVDCINNNSDGDEEDNYDIYDE